MLGEETSRTVDGMDKNEAIKKSLPIIKNLARRTKRPHSWDIEDVIQIGLLAILEHLPEFDPARGAFHAWAFIWARKAIVTETIKNQGAVCQNQETIRRNSKKNKKERVLFSATVLHDMYPGSNGGRALAAAELALVWPRLSPQRREVYARMALGENGVEIGDALGLSRERIRQIAANE